jgi:hypothetical protein
MGIIESIANTPVCKGFETLSRKIIPGAGLSIFWKEKTRQPSMITIVFPLK